MCGNMNDFGAVDDHLSLQGEDDPPPTTPNKVILLYSVQDNIYFVIISYIVIVLFHFQVHEKG